MKLDSSVLKRPPKSKAGSASSIHRPARRKGGNRRSQATIANILNATEEIVLESGANRVAILDVCRAAGVSRGTFYRYFSSRDELLDEFVRHKRERFHRALVKATEPFEDPDERFAALLAYLDEYLEHGKARRLLVVAPEYAMGFFKRIFHDSIVRFEDVLRPVFDAWDERFGIRIDRELVCEMLIRYVLSEQLVPSGADRRSLPRRVGRLISAIANGRLRRGARSDSVSIPDETE
jgi:AcrR family transcriptional regulator